MDVNFKPARDAKAVSGLDLTPCTRLAPRSTSPSSPTTGNETIRPPMRNRDSRTMISTASSRHMGRSWRWSAIREEEEEEEEEEAGAPDPDSAAGPVSRRRAWPA